MKFGLHFMAAFFTLRSSLTATPFLNENIYFDLWDFLARATQPIPKIPPMKGIQNAKIIIKASCKNTVDLPMSVIR